MDKEKLIALLKDKEVKKVLTDIVIEELQNKFALNDRRVYHTHPEHVIHK
jgi:hypothetical protein